jgi:hypothetical protein
LAAASLEKPGVLLSASVGTLDAARALGARLGRYADVRFGVWDEGSELVAPLDALASQLSEVDLVVALFGEDDRNGGRRLASVMFEVGMAMGSLGRERVFLAADSGFGLSFPFHLRQERFFVESLDDPSALDRLATLVSAQLAELGRRPRPAKRSVTVFFSYAGADRDFVAKLSSDLTRTGITCWLADEQIKPGAVWSEQIEQAVASSDRVVLVLSPQSVDSVNVRLEAELAQSQESRTGATILFPAVIDGSIVGSDTRWATLLRERDVVDFTQWQDRPSYERSLRQLLQGLSMSADRST